MNGKEISERYSKTGKLIETEQEIAWNELPSKAKQKMEDFLEDHDGEYKVLEAQEVKSDEFSGYEAKVRTKKSRTHLMEYFFNFDGSFHHQEEVKLKSIPTLN